MKIKRGPTSVSDARRRPQKPVEAPQTPVRGNKPGESSGDAAVGDWVQVRVDWIAAPQGSHRQGFGKSVKETNPKTEPYRQAVADAIQRYIEDDLGAIGDEWVPLDGHLECRIDFYMPPPPASDPDRPYPNTAPDIDKLVRSTFDGITRGKLWKDDARVVGLTTWEYFADSLEDTHVDIAVRQIA